MVVLRIVRKTGFNIAISLALTAVLAAAAGAVTEYEFNFHNYPNPFFPGDVDPSTCTTSRVRWFGPWGKITPRYTASTTAN